VDARVGPELAGAARLCSVVHGRRGRAHGRFCVPPLPGGKLAVGRRDHGRVGDRPELYGVRIWASGAGLRHLPVCAGCGVPDYRARGGPKWTAPRRPGRLFRRRGSRFVALVGCRRPRVAGLDAVLQSRGPPMEEAPRFRHRNRGSLCARVPAVLVRAATDLVQRGSVSRFLSRAVLARDDAPTTWKS
jgi:hypothetical protein